MVRLRRRYAPGCGNPAREAARNGVSLQRPELSRARRGSAPGVRSASGRVLRAAHLCAARHVGDAFPCAESGCASGGADGSGEACRPSRCGSRSDGTTDGRCRGARGTLLDGGRPRNVRADAAGGWRTHGHSNTEPGVRCADGGAAITVRCGATPRVRVGSCRTPRVESRGACICRILRPHWIYGNDDVDRSCCAGVRHRPLESYLCRRTRRCAAPARPHSGTGDRISRRAADDTCCLSPITRHHMRQHSW